MNSYRKFDSIHQFKPNPLVQSAQMDLQKEDLQSTISSVHSAIHKQVLCFFLVLCVRVLFYLVTLRVSSVAKHADCRLIC